MKEYRVYTREGGVFGLGSPVTECGIMYAAYQEAGGEIVTERGRLLFPCDADRFKEFQELLTEYQVNWVLAEKEENTFIVSKILKIHAEATDAEQEFLRKLALPVTFTDSLFGEFVLDKRVDMFDGSLEIQGNRITISLDQEKDVAVLHAIYPRMEEFLQEALVYAADHLLELGNDWCYDAWEGEEDEEFVPMTKEDFINRIALESISVSEDGEYTLWFEDGDIFWGHVICVEGNLEEGFTDADIQG